MRSVVAFLFFFLFVFSGANAQRKKQSTPPTLFSVNGRSISDREFIYLYNKNHQNKSEEFTKQKIDEYLDLFINFKLKVEEARMRGIDTTSAFRKEYNTYKEELRRPYLPEGKMIDSLVKLTYARLTEEVRASHILVGVAPDASPGDTVQAFNRIMEIKAKAMAGEDFGSLAATYSEDPSAKQNKGDLGYFTALQMVYPFETAAYSGKPGTVVGPVKTRFGYHILKIADRKPARGEVEVSHIMVRTGTDRDENNARNRIFEVYDELKGGVPWNELCAQYSEDLNSRSNNGRLRPFGVGAMASVPEFDQVAFALQNSGDISDPFQTAYGWHIVRLEQKIPLPSFEELAPTLRTRVQRDERVQVSKEALVKRLKNEYGFAENQAVKTKIFSMADSSLTSGKWVVTDWPASETVFTLKSKGTPARDFVKYVNENQRKANIAPDKYITQLYEGFVEAVINRVYEEQLVRANPDYEMLLKEYYEGILLFDIMEKEVWNKASQDSAGLRLYFNANARNYMAGERASVEIFSGSPDNISQVKASFEKPDSVAVEEMIKSRRVRKETGVFQRKDRPALEKSEWAVGTYSVENNGIYYLVRILGIIPPGQMTFDEAKAQAISDYQNYLEKNWVEELRKKYPVKINEKARQEVYKKLVRS